MTPAEFRIMREYLGLPPVWMAERLGVRERTVARWEHGHAPIPPGVVDEFTDILEVTARLVDSLIIQAGATGHLVTYRTDEDYRRSGSSYAATFPASWHRAVAARVYDAVPQVQITYSTDHSDDEAPGGCGSQV
ncbi:helix-turn-helix DNA binding domain protein [Mycobacterium phage Typha]|uniref:Antitoxin n=1 Tax=Mycobacterium phage Typha TaxID=2517971 RepID=A0A482J814_9CAUD|nr:HTH DNA binding protein [Mycobacterium phage Typha]QBP29703.1 helix-turn-helix DNA binding domain protein [Mycobacterium phage Typha]